MAVALGLALGCHRLAADSGSDYSPFLTVFQQVQVGVVVATEELLSVVVQLLKLICVMQLAWLVARPDDCKRWSANLRPVV